MTAKADDDTERDGNQRAQHEISEERDEASESSAVQPTDEADGDAQLYCVCQVPEDGKSNVGSCRGVGAYLVARRRKLHGLLRPLRRVVSSRVHRDDERSDRGTR